MCFGIAGLRPAQTLRLLWREMCQQTYRTFDIIVCMKQTIRAMFSDHPRLSRALKWDADDATLSGGERALAAVLAALANDFDALDGAEQRAIADTLTAQAEETERDEAAARKLLGL